VPGHGYYLEIGLAATQSMMIQECRRDVLCFAAVHEDELRRTEVEEERGTYLVKRRIRLDQIRDGDRLSGGCHVPSPNPPPLTHMPFALSVVVPQPSLVPSHLNASHSGK
jgi:hypothetical protein